VRELRSQLNDTLKAVDRHRAQLVAQKTLAQSLPADTRTSTLQRLDAEIASVDSALAAVAIPPGTRSWTEGPRLVERLGAIFSGVDGPNKAPTRAQVDLVGELRIELQRAMGRFQAIMLRRGVIS
jgi:hypothetical protein